MKTLQKYTLFATILMILAMTSCKKDPFLTVAETSILIPVKGGLFTFDVKSNKEWNITVIWTEPNQEEWFEISDTSGFNNKTININVAENTHYMARKAYVLVSIGNITKSIIVEQEQTCNCILDINCSHFIMNTVRFSEFPHDSTANIIGKWLLVASLYYSNIAHVSHRFKLCQDTIIYEFKENGIVTVSKDTPRPGFNFLSADDEHPYTATNQAFGMGLRLSTATLLPNNYISFRTKISPDRLVIQRFSVSGTPFYSNEFAKIN